MAKFAGWRDVQHLSRSWARAARLLGDMGALLRSVDEALGNCGPEAIVAVPEAAGVLRTAVGRAQELHTLRSEQFAPLMATFGLLSASVEREGAEHERRAAALAAVTTRAVDQLHQIDHLLRQHTASAARQLATLLQEMNNRFSAANAGDVAGFVDAIEEARTFVKVLDLRRRGDLRSPRTGERFQFELAITRWKNSEFQPPADPALACPINTRLEVVRRLREVCARLVAAVTAVDEAVERLSERARAADAGAPGAASQAAERELLFHQILRMFDESEDDSLSMTALLRATRDARAPLSRAQIARMTKALDLDHTGFATREAFLSSDFVAELWSPTRALREHLEAMCAALRDVAPALAAGRALSGGGGDQEQDPLLREARAKTAALEALAEEAAREVDAMEVADRREALTTDLAVHAQLLNAHRSPESVRAFTRAVDDEMRRLDAAASAAASMAAAAGDDEELGAAEMGPGAGVKSGLARLSSFAALFDVAEWQRELAEARGEVEHAMTAFAFALTALRAREGDAQHAALSSQIERVARAQQEEVVDRLAHMFDARRVLAGGAGDFWVRHFGSQCYQVVWQRFSAAFEAEYGTVLKADVHVLRAFLADRKSNVNVYALSKFCRGRSVLEAFQRLGDNNLKASSRDLLFAHTGNETFSSRAAPPPRRLPSAPVSRSPGRPDSGDEMSGADEGFM